MPILLLGIINIKTYTTILIAKPRHTNNVILKVMPGIFLGLLVAASAVVNLTIS